MTMENKMYFKLSNQYARGLLVICALGLGGNALAYETRIQNTKKHALLITHTKDNTTLVEKDKNPDGSLSTKEGWKLSSAGGLSYLHPEDDRFWFKFSGLVRLDETFFMGSASDKQNDLPSGINLRVADLYLNGGLGEDWSYSLSLSFASKFGWGESWVSYAGFHPNNQIYVGIVSGSWFGLDSVNSGSWSPFLEKSMLTSTFGVGNGLGIMTDFWGDIGGITLAAMQPDHGPSAADALPGVRDRWKGTIRATIAPVHAEGDVWHFGVSGYYRQIKSHSNGVAFSGMRFKSQQSARARNTVELLDTNLMQANNSRAMNVEFARQYGPFMLEAEYTMPFVHRVNVYNASASQDTVRFSGWNIQTRYLLTGEHHAYSVRDGNFGALNPEGPYGAFEVAARYDFLNLNQKNVRGGSAHDLTLGLNWYLNQNLRLSANYIRASVHPKLDAPKRNLDIIGMRCQVAFK